MRRNSDKRMLMRITINKLLRMRINSDKCSDNENHSHMQVIMRIILIGSTLVLQIPAKNLRIDICPINRPPASPPAFKPNPRRSPTPSKPEARKSPTLISQLQSPQPVLCQILCSSRDALERLQCPQAESCPYPSVFL